MLKGKKQQKNVVHHDKQPHSKKAKHHHNKTHKIQNHPAAAKREIKETETYSPISIPTTVSIEEEQSQSAHQIYFGKNAWASYAKMQAEAKRQKSNLEKCMGLLRKDAGGSETTEE
jgi:hypothetical protein